MSTPNDADLVAQPKTKPKRPRPRRVSLDDLPQIPESGLIETAAQWRRYTQRTIADCHALIDEAAMLKGHDRRIYASRAATLLSKILEGGKPHDGTGPAWLRAIRGVEGAFAAIGYTQPWRLRDDPWDAERPAPAPAKPKPACDHCGSLLRLRSPMLDTIHDGDGRLVATMSPVWWCCSTCRTISESVKLADRTAKHGQVIVHVRARTRFAMPGSFDDYVIGRRPRPRR